MAVHGPDRARNRRSLRLEALLGREVRAANNRVIGRLEEIRVAPSGRDYLVTEYVIGPAGLFERLGLTLGSIAGVKGSGYVARSDQVDIADPYHPRLTCALADLREL